MTGRATGPVVLSTRSPFDGSAALAFLRAFGVPGVETWSTDDGVDTFARTLTLPQGPGRVRLSWDGAVLRAELAVVPGDEDAALGQVRRLLDLDVDPNRVEAHLARDPDLAPRLAAAPGLRIPGTVDPGELALRTVLGQQVSMAAAARCATKLTHAYGVQLPAHPWGADWLFPTPRALAGADPLDLPMPRARGRCLVELARRLADGELDLSGSEPVPATRAALLACPGIGPWTADAVAMRGLGDLDVLLGTDLAVRRELVALGSPDTDAWAPYRSYVTVLLWRPYVV
ncbi:MAG: DNA-3-methyladenine glycosylase [Friedmanniella sp.]|nr:DNA-3-methyladenine glycosylase [Friedmanniella sp.]